MTVFDYAVFGVVILSVSLGLWRGVVGEVLAILAWVLAFFVARLAGPSVAPLLATRIADPGMRIAVAWVLVFIVVLLLLALVRQLLKLLLRTVGLGWLDRLLGACFGVMRGVLVVLFGVLVAGLTPLPSATWWREAALSPPFETVVVAGKPWMPRELAQRVKYR